MSVDYTPVLTDLRAKRVALAGIGDVIDDLIIGLDKLSRLNPADFLPDPVIAPARAPDVAPAPRAVERVTLARGAPTVTEKPGKRASAGSHDGAILAALRASRDGLRLCELQRVLDTSAGSAFSLMRRLVRDGAARRTADGLYRAAGKPAKEAP